MANNKLKEGKVVNVSEKGLDLGYYVDGVDAVGKRLTSSIAKSLKEQSKMVTDAMSEITKGLKKEQKDAVSEIAKAAKDFDSFKAKIESENISLNIDEDSFAPMYNKAKQLSEDLTEAEKQAQIENAKVEKKLYDERWKRASVGEKQLMKEQEVAIIQKYRTEQEQAEEVSKARLLVIDDERQAIMNNSKLSQKEKEEQLKLLEKEAQETVQTIIEANENATEASKKEAVATAEAFKFKAKATEESTAALVNKVSQGALNNDKRLTDEDGKKLKAGERAKNSRNLAEEAKSARNELGKSLVQGKQDAQNILDKYGLVPDKNGNVNTKGMSPEDKEIYESLIAANVSLQEQMGALKEVEEEANDMAKKDERKQKIADRASKLVDSALTGAATQIDSAINTFYQYQAKMEARLQGSDKKYSDSLLLISRNIGLNPYIKQRDVITKLQSLIESGIAYDVEARAYLGVIAQDIASTFEVTNATLNRMIRLQQADTTASRLGMEAYLTKFYNKLFSDTSYLTDQFDSVTDAIFEASANLEKAQSVEFEYAVQKWLGALYSLGLSSSTVNTIAQGLNYLGTGDVEALNSNSQLTTLFGMSASKAGIPYAEILTNGLDASGTNKLLEAMVKYLKEIAEQTVDNNVVAKSYANILGITTSDLKVMQSLDSTTINSIANNMMEYKDTLSELSYQMSQISKRTHLSTKLGTLGDNALLASATAIGSTPVYPLWWVTNLVKSITGGIPIPAAWVAGFGLDLEAKVEDLILTGIGGLGLLGSLMSAITSGGSVFGTTDLTKWGYQETLSRGSVPEIGNRGVQIGLSNSNDYSSGSTSSGSGSDIEDSTLASAGESAKKKTSITNQSAGTQPEHTLDDVYKNLFEDQIPIDVKLAYDSEDVLSKIYGSLFEDRKAVLAEVYGSSGSGDGSDTISSQSYFSRSMGDSTVSLQTTAQAVTESTSYNASSASSLQQTLTKINQLTEDGETSLSVNVKNVPNMTLSGISDDVKNEIKSYIEDKLKDLLSEAISSGMSFTDEEDSSTLSIQGMLKNIMDNVGLTQSNASDISNQMGSLMFRTNM